MSLLLLPPYPFGHPTSYGMYATTGYDRTLSLYPYTPTSSVFVTPLSTEIFENLQHHLHAIYPIKETSSPTCNDSDRMVITKDGKRIKRCGTICIKYIFGTPHVLVVRGKKTRIWSLPKGCIDPGESELACAHRETLEEAGLFVELTPTNARVCINHNVYFLAFIHHHSKLKIRDRCEIDKVHWMTLSELRDLECNKDLRSILQYPNRQFHFHYLLQQPLQLDKLTADSKSSDDEKTPSKRVLVCTT
jgi:8-oxo-dGTP pyrophosphatase MutT (NUDIX family)